MLVFLQKLVKNLPTFLLAFALSLAVWVSAVSASDPTQKLVYPNRVPLDVVGLDPGMVLVSEVPEQVIITLSAPQSIWNQLVNEVDPISALIDLSGLEAGTYQIPVQVRVTIHPIRIVSYTPEEVTIRLEKLESKSLPITLNRIGEPGVGFQAEEPVMEIYSATISGSSSLVQKVKELRAPLDISKANENIERRIPIQAFDEDGFEVDGISISPEDVAVTQNISQLGGYRNVVIKVVVTGQVANGYRVTNISVYPPTVTVFSTDPKLVDQLPGYIETTALDLDNATDDLDTKVLLNLPPGISVVGEDTVEVQVGIAAIEGSITIESTKVEVTGLKEGLAAEVAPETVDVILSGPLPLLEDLTSEDIRVFVELAEEDIGTYQRLPVVELAIEEIVVESILPVSVEVTVSKAPIQTPGP